MRKLFKMSSEECEYHFAIIVEPRLKSGSMVKTLISISQKNISCVSIYGLNASDVFEFSHVKEIVDS